MTLWFSFFISFASTNLSFSKPDKGVLITRPDKGSGVVTLNKTDYITKINSVLKNETKYLTLGECRKNDNTSKIKSRIQRRFLQMLEDDWLPKNLCKLIPPTGLQRSCMYGLPKHTRRTSHSDPSCL